LKTGSGITGIILSGGKSSRMGFEKGLALLNGKPLVEWAMRALEGLCESIIISANSSGYQYLGLRTVPDEIQGRGPAGGIYSCLMASQTTDNLIVSCDTPLISPVLLKSMLVCKNNYQTVVPVHKGLFEPLCAYYRKDCTQVFQKALDSGVYKLLDIIKRLRYHYLSLEINSDLYDPLMFANVNSPEDLEKLAILLKTNEKDE